LFIISLKIILTNLKTYIFRKFHHQKMATKILILPGLGGSGENHWQSFWSRELDHTHRLEQDNWEEPELDKWLERLNETLLKINGPLILVAHSLAVSLVAHWDLKYHNPNIKGALLVAPADVDSPAYPFPPSWWPVKMIPL
jgi:predicted alpha/beta hydrolase family esterase